MRPRASSGRQRDRATTDTDTITRSSATPHTTRNSTVVRVTATTIPRTGPILGVSLWSISTSPDPPDDSQVPRSDHQAGTHDRQHQISERAEPDPHDAASSSL